MNLSKFRIRRKAALAFLAPIWVIVMKTWPAGSFVWYAVGIAVLLMAIAYLVEEGILMRRGQGRRCLRCGGEIRLRSFRVRNSCPHCGEQL